MRPSSFLVRYPVLALTGALIGGAATAARADCTCTGMKVSHTDGAKVKICSNNNLPDFAECTRATGSTSGCGGFTYSYTCPVGVNSKSSGQTPSQKTGFGIEATITGTAGQCQSGHALQETITSDKGVTQPNVHPTPSGDVTIGKFHVTIIGDPNKKRSRNPRSPEFPQVGEMTGPNGHPLFGADSYTNPAAKDELIEKTKTYIKWWDNPDQSKDTPKEKATWKFRYFSYVTGNPPNGSCGCVFDIEVDWKGSTPATKWTLDAGSSTNCTF